MKTNNNLHFQASGFFKTGRILIFGLIIFHLSCVVKEGNKENINPPNILLVFTDQQNINMMSAMGNPLLHTPVMDDLARGGVMFTESYCASPVCAPARSSIISGLMPHETGVEWNGDEMLEKVKNAGEVFRKAGYQTIWAGKWHLPESYPQRAASKQKNIRGFEMLPFYDPESTRWLLGADTDPPLTEAVIEFLDNYHSDKPFFLAVSYHNPHDICLYPRKIGWQTDQNGMINTRPFGKYKLPAPLTNHPDSIEHLPPLPHNFEINSGEPDFIKEKRTLDGYGDELKMASVFNEKEWQGYLEAYCKLTEMVDEEIGKVITALDQQGLRENTLIVFTSDHGDGAAAHRWAAKLSLYEEATKVPLIINWPGNIPENRVDDKHLVSQIDIVPTLVDYAGIKPEISFTGASLRTIIEKPDDASWREYLVVELADYKPVPGRKGRMVRSQQYKYNIFSHGRANEQLFDLRNDPGETQNLADEPRLESIKEYHKRKLKEWMKQTGDTFEVIDGKEKLWN